jgi:hypothetical protein
MLYDDFVVRIIFPSLAAKVNIDTGAPVAEVASGYQSISAIITRSYKEKDLLTDYATEPPFYLLGKSEPGVLHEHICWNALIGRATLNTLHFIS